MGKKTKFQKGREDASVFGLGGYGPINFGAVACLSVIKPRGQNPVIVNATGKGLVTPSACQKTQEESSVIFLIFFTGTLLLFTKITSAVCGCMYKYSVCMYIK